MSHGSLEEHGNEPTPEDELYFNEGWRAGAACMRHYRMIDEGKRDRRITDFADLIGTFRVDVPRMAISILRTGGQDDCALADILEREALALNKARRNAQTNAAAPGPGAADSSPSGASRFYIPTPDGPSEGSLPPISPADERSWAAAFSR